LEVCRKLETPFKVYATGYEALKRYSKVAISCGRVSVDVIEGITDSGEVIRDVVDITPRVGGATPAEVLAIRELDKHQATLCYASSRLIYDPKAPTETGVNFIDTDSLIINAAVSEVIIR
jgi:hypothetical protein